MLRLGTADGRLVLEVTDDGGGFDPQASRRALAPARARSMEERARRLGGRLAIESAAGEGTTVRLEAPLA